MLTAERVLRSVCLFSFLRFYTLCIKNGVGPEFFSFFGNYICRLQFSNVKV